MSQIANFTLFDKVSGEIERELPDGGCSGEVYTALLVYLEEECDVDYHALVPQEFDALDCARFDHALAATIFKVLQTGPPLPKVAEQIAVDWEVPSSIVEQALRTLLENLQQVGENRILLYELA